MGLDLLLPAFAAHGLAWRARFRSLGYSHGAAWKAAFSKGAHAAFESSRIAHLPLAVRGAPGLVVDVGANEGQWLCAYLRFSRPRRIEVFEPIPRMHEILKNKFAGLPGLRIHSTALGDHPGTATLKVLRQSDLTSLLEPAPLLREQFTEEGLEVVETVEVPVTTLDHVIGDSTKVDLLKIDVQGAERSVLNGAIKTLHRTRVLLIETNLVRHYEGDDDLLALGNLLHRDFGFELWDIAPPSHGADGRALWCDAVFVNPTFVE